MNKFAFIIHPLEVEDYYRKFPFLKRIPETLIEKTFRYLPAMKVSEIKGVKSPWAEVEGYFIACPLTTRQLLEMPEEITLKKIQEAVNLAEKMGVKIVGLGAMTSVVGDGGISIAKNSNIAVTTGNSYTVASAIEATIQGANLMDIDLKKANVVVLGATGSIGSVIAKIMAPKCKNLILLARNNTKLSKLARTIMYEHGTAIEVSSNSKNVLRKGDIIFAVTSAVDTIIEPEDLKPGAIVCDVARPRDVSYLVEKRRNDVLVIEGGVIKVPGPVNFNFNFGFPPGLAYACMAETMILALEERFESFSLGRDLSLEKIEEISNLARKHNFQVEGMRSFERKVTIERIKEIKQNALRKMYSNIV